MPSFEITIKVELPEDFGTFQATEKKIFNAVREGGKELMSRVMMGYEAYFFEKMPVQKKDRRQKTFETLVGIITINRWRAKHVFKGVKRQIFKPIDEWVGLVGRERSSEGYCKELVHQCTTKVYKRATDDVAKITGVKRSVSGNWNLLQRYSTREQKNERRTVPNWRYTCLPEFKNAEENICPLLAIDPDETYIRPRRKKDKNHSIKIGVLYEAKKVKNSKKKKRRELVQKQVVIGTVDEKAGPFFNKVVDKAVNDYGAHQNTKVICHGDGAGWIKQLGDHYMPNTLNRLDPYHAFEKIKLELGLKEVPADWISDYYKDADALINKIKTLKRELAEREDQNKAEKLIRYFEKNKDGMLPSGVSKEFKAQHPYMYLRGSGTVENKIVMAQVQKNKFYILRLFTC